MEASLHAARWYRLRLQPRILFLNLAKMLYRRGFWAETIAHLKIITLQWIMAGILPFTQIYRIFNYYYLFLIPKLKLFTSATPISTYNDYAGVDNAYYKAGLIEIIYIFIENTIFSLKVIYKYKLLINNL